MGNIKISDLGAELDECEVCGIENVLRFNVCRECDDAFGLTRLSKKHENPSNHNIHDIKHIRKCMKQRSDIIQGFYEENAP